MVGENLRFAKAIVRGLTPMCRQLLDCHLLVQARCRSHTPVEHASIARTNSFRPSIPRNRMNRRVSAFDDVQPAAMLQRVTKLDRSHQLPSRLGVCGHRDAGTPTFWHLPPRRFTVPSQI